MDRGRFFARLAPGLVVAIDDEPQPVDAQRAGLEAVRILRDAKVSREGSRVELLQPCDRAFPRRRHVHIGVQGRLRAEDL